MKKHELPDFVILLMGASATYFVLVILRQIKRLGIYTINNSNNIEIIKDKLFSQQILAQNDLPVPKAILAKFPIDIDLVKRTLSFSVVIKTIAGFQGPEIFLTEINIVFLMRCIWSNQPIATLT